MKTPWHYLAWVLLPARTNGGLGRYWYFLAFLHLLPTPPGLPYKETIISSVITSRHFIRLKYLEPLPTAGLAPHQPGGQWSFHSPQPIWFSGHPVAFAPRAIIIEEVITAPSGPTQWPVRFASRAKPIGVKILFHSYFKMHIATSCIWL